MAGPGVAVGTPFTFNVSSGPAITIPAGPAPAGNCADGPNLPTGTNVTVTEIIPPGDTVSSITVTPPGQLVSSNLATGTANVTIGADDTVVTYTDTSPNQTSVVTGCLKDMNVTVKCNPDGTYTVTLSGSGFTGTDISLTSQTAGVTVSPAQQPWAATTTWTITGATPGETVVLTANATNAGGGTASGSDQCCSGQITIVMPNCPPQTGSLVVVKKVVYDGPVSFPPQTFPVTVTCGSTVTNLNLVTGVPQTINGIPLGTSCSVVEGIVAPPNVCRPPTTPAWTTTYAPPSPVTITAATTTVTVTNTLVCRAVQSCQPPQVANAAGVCVCPPPMIVGAAPNSCVCPSPLVMNPATGQCGCPQGTVLRGNECVRPIVCKPPLILNPAGTACTCLQGTVQRGNECVWPIVCRPPQVANAAGTACECPQGTVLRGNECVRPIVCRPPLTLNPAGTACSCPQGTVQRGNECVRSGPGGGPARGGAQPGGGAVQPGGGGRRF